MAACFYYPPDFDTAANVGRIDFANAQVVPLHPWTKYWTKVDVPYWTKDSRVPARLRAFRKIAEETKYHDLERDLYIEERKAERGVYLRQLLDELKRAPETLKKKLEDIDEQQREVWSNWRHRARARVADVFGIVVKIARLIGHVLWIAVIFGYWALADYGSSFARPFAWLIASMFFFDWGYTKVLATLMAKAPDVDKYKHAVGMLALGNAVPFVGPLTIDTKIKEFLFCAGEVVDKCTPIPPEGFQCLVIFQNLFSITCVFFIGLALRNYFKIK